LSNSWRVCDNLTLTSLILIKLSLILIHSFQ